MKKPTTRCVRPPKGAGEGSRNVPAHVARAVWRRDGERCAFVAKGGRRCGESRYLQLHHIHPYGYDGPATVENISVRCRAHNLYESELVYGPFQKASTIRERREDYGVSGPTRAVPGRKTAQGGGEGEGRVHAES